MFPSSLPAPRQDAAAERMQTVWARGRAPPYSPNRRALTVQSQANALLHGVRVRAIPVARSSDAWTRGCPLRPTTRTMAWFSQVLGGMRPRGRRAPERSDRRSISLCRSRGHCLSALAVPANDELRLAAEAANQLEEGPSRPQHANATTTPRVALDVALALTRDQVVVYSVGRTDAELGGEFRPGGRESTFTDASLDHVEHDRLARRKADHAALRSNDSNAVSQEPKRQTSWLASATESSMPCER